MQFTAGTILPHHNTSHGGLIDMKVFAWSPIRELMKEAGAEMVSKDAVDELISYLEKYAKALTTRALEMTRHSQRKKLTKSDMEMALELMD
ncbi:histone [Candidatus Harpocratesius sp.]